jgi:glycosyltransferase involved in cell wall biosynthesis
MSTPRVSVIVPNYNHARYLGARLGSILAQTFGDFEWIYLDDASTDASDAVFAAFAREPRLAAVLRNAENSGSPFAQWNRGARTARGEYLWIAETDDIAEPTLLEALVRRLDENPGVGVAYCQSHLIDEEGRRFGSALEYNRNLGADARRWEDDYVNDGRDECARHLARQCTIPNASAVLFRRGVFEAVGGADEGMRVCGDYLLWAKMLLASDLAFVAEPLNGFRTHRGSVRHRAYRDGTALEEMYRVLTYIRSRAHVPDDALAFACDRLMDRWTDWTLLHGPPPAASRSRLGRILRLQRQADPAPVARFVRRFAARTATKLGAVRRRAAPGEVAG